MKRYTVVSAFLICTYTLFAQVNFTGNESNQLSLQMVNSAGNKTNAPLSNDFINASENNNPSVQQQIQNISQVSAPNKNIEPSLDNGFHIRFQIASPSVNESALKSSRSSYHKSKKNFVLKNFNFKNRMKHLLPKRKKAYNTYLCSRF